LVLAFRFDFVSGVSLFINAVKALDDVNGAPAEIRMLRTELEILQSAMEAVKNCNLQETSPYYETAIKSAQDCKDAIDTFKLKVPKYLEVDKIHPKVPKYLEVDKIHPKVPKYPEVDKIHQTVKKNWRNVKWALIRKDDVNDLRSQIGTQTTALNLLLSAILLSRETMAGKHSASQLSKQTEIITEIHKHLDRSDAEHAQLLQRIESLVASLVPSPPYPGPGSYFEVRPLRLIGAPVIDMDHFVDRPEVMTSIELDFSSFPDTMQKIVVLQGDFLFITILGGRMRLTS